MEPEEFLYVFRIPSLSPPPSKGIFLFGKTGSLRRREKTKRKCGNNIDVDLRVIESGSVIWIHLAQIIDQSPVLFKAVGIIEPLTTKGRDLLTRCAIVKFSRLCVIHIVS